MNSLIINDLSDINQVFLSLIIPIQGVIMGKEKLTPHPKRDSRQRIKFSYCSDVTKEQPKTQEGTSKR
jgi:hypothetical protein